MNSTPISEAATVPLPVRPLWGGLASGAVWTVAASLATALSQWLLLMVTAKLGSTEMVGQLAMSFAIVAPMQALTDLALRPALATDARGDFGFRDYLRLRALTMVVFVAAVGVAASWQRGSASPIIVAIGLQKAVESFSDLFFGLFQREDKLPWMGQSVVVRTTLSSIVFVGLMLAFGDLLWACLAGLAVRIGVFLALDLTRGSSLVALDIFSVTGEDRTTLLLKASLPLTLGLFLMSFAVNIPRYVVEMEMGVAALGVFAALVYFFQAGAMLIDAIGQAACQRLSRYYVLGRRQDFRSLLLKLAAVAGVLSGGAIVVALAGGAPLLRLVYSAAFAAQAKTFLLLSGCTLPWYCSSILGYGLVAARKTKA